MNNLAEFFKALSEPIRLRIINLLARVEGEGELCVCDFMAALGLPQSTASRHVTLLRRAGFVESRRARLWTYYRLSNNPVHEDLRRAVVEAAARADGADEDLAALQKYLKTKQADACDASAKQHGDAHV